ncbi:HEAT repeat domain-containing protein [Neobacillus drentensis]|uniref:HEAT repeat domain-containing protein n=1 Tax=Neobacillus drentensis TaxID=220684 RepID=UPI003002B635
MKYNDMENKKVDLRTDMMTFLEKIKPHIISNDVLIQETVLHALHDYPNVPEEWMIELLKEAFAYKDKQSSILIYIENMKFNEGAVKLLLKNIRKMDKSEQHLAVNLLERVEPKLALKYKEQMQRMISKENWSLYELIVNGTEEEVYAEFSKTVLAIEQAKTFQHTRYINAKKLAACIVQNGWITENEIDQTLQKELKEDWFSVHGILTIYMLGLLNLKKYIPIIASLLVRDDDILLEEVANALIRFQSDEVVEAVGPYLKQTDSIIFACSVIENIKTDHAVQVLREAYQKSDELEDQDMLIEALCHQLSKEALPEISSHMEKESFSCLVDIEQTVYSYYSILGEEHPELESWKQAAQGGGMDYRNENLSKSNIGRNDPCQCGSGKKYKKCCGK